MKRTLTLEPRYLIPGVFAALAVTLGLGWKMGQQAALKPTGESSVAAALSSVTLRPGATPQPTTPNAILDGIPDAKTKTAANKEVLRWREGARLKPKVAAMWVNLGDALMQRSRDAVDPHDCDWARLAYEQAIKLDPKRAAAMVGLSHVAGTLHQFEDSISWAKRAIAINKDDPAPYGLIGDAQLEMGDYDAAFESYQQMLDIRPDMSSYSRGAHLLYVTGDTRKALWLMQKAIEAGGPYTENGAWCRAQYAEMLWSMGAILAAENVVREALKDAPNNYHLLTMQGRVKEAKQDAKGAMDAYQKAVAVSPQHNALVALGDLYLSLGKTADAEKMFAQVEVTHQHHQSHGSHDGLYMARFWADHDRKLDKAKAVVEKYLAEKGEPKGISDLDNVAWIQFKLGNVADAKKYIDKATKKGSPDAMRLFHAGMIYAGAGEETKAQKYLTNALNRNPGFHPIYVKVAAAKIKEIGAKPRHVAAAGKTVNR